MDRHFYESMQHQLLSVMWAKDFISSLRLVWAFLLAAGKPATYANAETNCNSSTVLVGFTVSTAVRFMVRQDFERYRPSLERMVGDWQEAKKTHQWTSEGH